MVEGPANTCANYYKKNIFERISPNASSEIQSFSFSQPAITYSKLTIQTPERRYWRRSGVFIVNLEHMSHLVLLFLLLTLSR